MPLALQSHQAVKEESAAASSTTDLARVCGQQSQPPLRGCNTEISGLEKHLLHLPSYLGVYHSMCAQSMPVCPSIAGSTKPPWRSCQGRQLAASFAALLRAGILVGFTYGKWFFSHGLYLTSFCLCSIKSLEQDEFVSFPLIWHLAANTSQIPHPEPSSCLTMWHISSWSSL